MTLLKTYSISTDITLGAVDPAVLHEELDAAGDIVNFDGLDVNGDDLCVFGDSFTEANVDATVLSHGEVSLADYKQGRYNEIDYKTGVLISAGFTYDSQVFSLSALAQSNWNTLKSQESEFTWPVIVSLLNSDEYSLAQANLDAFWTAGKDTLKGHLDSGRSLKKSVFDAVDKAAVDAVVDNR